MMEKHKEPYEPPMLVEVGNFTKLTCGFGSSSVDASDYFSSFLFWR
jgi:hypothetical protein